MSVPATTKAVVIQGPGVAKIEEVAVPALRPGYILVKTSAVALNPTDWKHIEVDLLAKPGLRSGCDYTGTVVEVGSEVTVDFKRGDRIAGVAHGGNQSNKEDGGFAGYIVVKGDVQVKVPDNIPDEEAATWGVTVCTIAQGLYQTLGLPLPSKAGSSTPGAVLIYGGSTATGIGGIQFAKASGYKVLTTASPKHHDYLRSIGADEVFDYNSPTCGSDINTATNNSLVKAWDCISLEGSAAICAQALSSTAANVTYASLLFVAMDMLQKINPNIASNQMTLAYTIFNEPFTKGAEYPAIPTNFEFAKMFWQEARVLLEAGKVKLAKPIVNQGGEGLEGVMVGLDTLKAGKVSGGKLVYTL